MKATLLSKELLSITGTV